MVFVGFVGLVGWASACCCPWCGSRCLGEVPLGSFFSVPLALCAPTTIPYLPTRLASVGLPRPYVRLPMLRVGEHPRATR